MVECVAMLSLAYSGSSWCTVLTTLAVAMVSVLIQLSLGEDWIVALSILGTVALGR